MKQIVVLAFCSLLFAAPAMAGFEGPAGKAEVTSTEQIANARDDAHVEMVGQIVERVGGSSNKYVFKDAAGTVVVKISDRVFGDKKVTPENKVHIWGEVEVSKKNKPSYVEVDKLAVE